MKTAFTLSSLSLLIASSSFAQNMSSEEIQAVLTGAHAFDEKCFVDLSISTADQLPRGCEQYIFINSSELDTQQRKEKSAHLIGVGFDNPYILVKNPYSQSHSVISLYNDIDAETLLAEIDKPIATTTHVEPRMSTLSRTRRSVGSNPSRSASNIVTTKYIRTEIPFTATERYNGTQKAVFEYKLDFFSRYPFFDQFGQYADNKKFVRVSLLKGLGINFHSEGKWPRSWTQPGYADHHSRYYSYPDFLDQVSMSTAMYDGDVELYDFIPKNTDKELSTYTKTSTVDINIGVSIPKVPIKSVGVKTSETVTYENGDYMGYDVTTGTRSFNILYRNKKYGSHIAKDTDGYCNLLKNIENWCWDYSKGSYDDPIDLGKLYGTPYSNGFVPVFSSTYAVPYHKTGLSTIHIGATVTGMNVLGYAYWKAGRLYYHGSQASYNPYGEKYRLHRYSKSTPFTIDWSSSIFSGAQPVTLSSLKGSDQESQCLTVQTNDLVALSNCEAGNPQQLFYYTPSNKKYVYANGLNKCLSTEQDQLSLTDCSRTRNSNNLVWEWFDNSRNFSLLYTQNIHGVKVLKPSDDGSRIDVLQLESEELASKESLFDSRLGDFNIGG